ncbi:40S ribosomal protein S17 [Raphidocelis subcapitata]|uniref:40S ribosomal protein S17 n=1 Tax=Raphidocelis subcapitata TaxID=307507 RepID=A0A2V0NQL6_9CHLO|nr:40S ribosomal protein S17 [Raphidocelis subcapitata]|eukprot:GBF87840.1 40S ribosomal protein S17 [Raphidocelis subcapitata]
MAPDAAVQGPCGPAAGAAAAAAASVVLLAAAAAPATAADLPSAFAAPQAPEVIATLADAGGPAFAAASAAPSLVASPLSGDATADLTAAVTQQVVTAALSPAASGELGAAAAAAQAPPASAVVEGLKAVVSEGIQGANLAESPMPAVGSWLSASPLCGMWRAYCSSLAQAPLPTKAATGVLGSFLGDLLAQHLAHWSERRRQQQQPGSPRRARRSSSPASLAAEGGFQYDAARFARLAAFSALIATPMAHYWYLFLDAAVFPDAPTCAAAVGLKVAMDQCLQTPFGMALFFASQKLLEGRPGEALPDVQAKLLPALLTSFNVWVPAQLINFTVVPLDLRILYVNVISIAWTAYISNMANGGGEDAAAPAAPEPPLPALAAAGGGARARERFAPAPLPPRGAPARVAVAERELVGAGAGGGGQARAARG